MPWLVLIAILLASYIVAIVPWEVLYWCLGNGVHLWGWLLVMGLMMYASTRQGDG